MHQDLDGQSFTASTKELEGGIIEVTIVHLQPKERKVQKEEKRQVMKEVTTKKKDPRGKFIIERIPEMETVTIEETVIDMKEVEIGAFNIYTKVRSADIRKMVKTWLANSTEVAKILKKYGSKKEGETA